ncbi:FAD binding domain-containing protein [Microvirga aerophila]|uniref:Molybdopterin dehydrogenase n=1 Tax=Microvirga aerophila TaxID=670291 RepID=A0A512BSI5_9HYPH|nr:xanthine dehydrogenase family protein subunit M [Microvirga aerophila]GEO14882.1 molybdopterin dehydrogenase [Microvirga aerophila]
MKASDFNYVCPSSVEEATSLLALHGDGAKVIAGGQSLVPALNLRLLAPEILIDIGRIGTLRYISVADGMVRIGALARHVDLLNSQEIAEHVPLLAEAITYVAHPAIRNRGTIGGNLAHADPASELPACMMALDAVMVISGPSGERRVAASEFFLGIYETALAPDELLIGLEIPVTAAGSRFYFHEFSRRNGDFAIAGLAAQANVRDGTVESLRLAYFAIGGRPTLAAHAAAKVARQPIGPAVIADAQSALAEDLEPHDDQQASSAMRLHLAKVLLERCMSDLVQDQEMKRKALQ